MSEGPSCAQVAAQMRPALVRYFRRGGGNPEAEDLAQDVIVRCLAHTLEGTEEQIRGYLFRAARNRWHDRGRRLASHGTSVGWDDETPDLPHEAATPERLAVIDEEVRGVARRFRELESRTRMIVFWVKVEEMQIDTVARKLDVSRSTVNKCLARGLAYLRDGERQLG